MTTAKRSWLDRIAPVKPDASSIEGGGMILLAVVTLAAGIGSFFLPAGATTRLMHIPLSFLAPVLVLGGLWFLLVAINCFRHAR